ncbi:prepilin-type N-terminal cleavage/methylation domain-containing protein [Candidatus Poribacteria bacterium]|nr:prepilin-type N-terminal cleavage/methylation domain-containing protein [Candidatus Poribacteria bacterium]
MKSYLARLRRGVTLIELLVVLAIISMLATIAVPVFVSKTEQARRSTARFEVREIANAEEVTAITHGFYVPMHILDNVPNLPTGVADTDARDDFRNYPSPQSLRVINPFISVRDQVGDQSTLNIGTASSTDRVAQMVNFWNGPFLNPARVYRGTRGINDPQALTQAEVSYDMLLDPWGTPYRFYSPLGIIATNNEINADLDTNPWQVDDGLLQDDATSDRFDRFAVVSFGANGLPDRLTTVDDDIYFEFGYEANESSFNIF